VFRPNLISASEIRVSFVGPEKVTGCTVPEKVIPAVMAFWKEIAVLKMGFDVGQGARFTEPVNMDLSSIAFEEKLIPGFGPNPP